MSKRKGNLRLKRTTVSAVNAFNGHKLPPCPHETQLPEIVDTFVFEMTTGRCAQIASGMREYLSDMFEAERGGLTLYEARANFWKEVSEKRDFYNAVRAFVNDPAVMKAMDAQCVEPVFEAIQDDLRARGIAVHDDVLVAGYRARAAAPPMSLVAGGIK